MPRVEIRCCCEPGKLLGTIETDLSRHQYAALFIFMHDGPDMEDGPSYWHVSQLALWVGAFVDGEGNVYRALKADRKQLPLLRQISSFEEAAPDGHQR